MPGKLEAFNAPHIFLCSKGRNDTHMEKNAAGIPGLPNHRMLILSAFCVCLLCVSVSADYTIADLSGSIVRGHQFTVDITGNPDTAYYVWLTGTWSLSGEAYDEPPVIVANQANVQQDPDNGPYTIGSYKYYNGNGRTILDDVAPSSSLVPCTSYYALVTTDDSGQAVVAFETSVNTALRSYSVRVENPTSVNNNTLLVQQGGTTVTGGSMSIYASGSRPPRPTFPPTTVPTPTPTPTPTETTPVATPATTVPATTTAPLDSAILILALGAGVCAVRYR